MASPADTLKFCLFTYPSIFPEPINVLDNWFTSIGSVEWNSKGEISDPYSRVTKNVSMKYEDLDKREQELIERDSPLTPMFRLQIEAERIRRKFIADNIDTITKDSYNWTFNFFGHAFKHCENGRTQNIHLNYANGLNFPDNITKEWGEVLYRYLDHWLQQINARYIPGNDKDDREKHWPEDIKVAYKAIKDAKKRLHPLIRNGETWEQHCANMREIMKPILEALDKK